MGAETAVLLASAGLYGCWGTVVGFRKVAYGEGHVLVEVAWDNGPWKDETLSHLGQSLEVLS